MQIIKKMVFLLFFSYYYSECVRAQTCTLTVGSPTVNFGTFNPFQLSPITGINQVIRIRCRGPNRPVIYTLESTAGGGGGYTPYRTMRRNGVGPEILNYNFYRDAARTMYWGVNPNSFVNAPGARCRSNNQCQHIAYGLVPAPQPTVRGGPYSATITATLTYNP